MKILLSLTLALLTITAASAQSHGHINAGAKDTNGSGAINAGDQLFMYFEGDSQLTTLAYNGGTGTYGADSFLWNGYTTFTSLHQSSDPLQAPNYNSLGALSGSFLQLSLVSVSGPVGTKLAFYESGATDPTWIYQIGTGLLSGDGTIPLTDPAWFAGSAEDGIPSDPYGHIHGRMFGVDGSGDFIATWVLKDTQSATTGLLDSTAFTTTFTAAAVPEPATWILLGLASAIFLLRRIGRRDGALSLSGFSGSVVPDGSGTRPADEQKSFSA